MKKQQCMRSILLGLGFMLMFLATSVMASALSLSPIHIYLSAKKPITTLRIKNISRRQGIVLQLRAFKWGQQHGKNKFARTKDILISPPIIKIDPGTMQIVRIGLRHPVATHKELSYRLIAQEVPPPMKNDFSGLEVVLRESLPIFVEPVLGKKPNVAALQWQARVMKDNKIQLTLHNEGGMHVEVSKLVLAKPGTSKPIVAQEAFAYVLPNQTHRWLIKPTVEPGAAVKQLRLTADTDWGNVTENIKLNVG